MPFDLRRFDELPDVALVLIQPVEDERGWFMETYTKTEFARLGITQEFVQHNHSRSKSTGVLRGLHFQKLPAGQAKLVRCVAGEIFDVAVDIRRGSASYGKWVSAVLSAQNRLMMWIPIGFAHGFLTTADGTEVEYRVTAEFNKELDRAIRWNDPAIGIKWPHPSPILSRKDATAPFLKDADNNFIFEGEQ